MKILALIFCSFFLCSCTALSKKIKEMAGTPTETRVAEKKEEPLQNSFSQTNDYQAYPLPERQYGERRMNRETFEQEAKVEADAGSLWVNEGQGSYLFSQNQRRLEGDVLNVNLEDQATEQLNAKVTVISDLLKQKEDALKRQVASTPKAGADGQVAPPAAAAASPEANKKEEINVKQVPTRVIATYPDGSYRVKGTKNVMIRNREFQVLVTGLVRGNDIADDSISSAKLLDSKFDIITNRKIQ